MQSAELLLETVSALKLTLPPYSEKLPPPFVGGYALLSKNSLTALCLALFLFACFYWLVSLPLGPCSLPPTCNRAALHCMLLSTRNNTSHAAWAVQAYEAIRVVELEIEHELSSIDITVLLKESQQLLKISVNDHGIMLQCVSLPL